MSIRFACEECRRVYDLPDESAGRQAKCECGEMLVVPAASTYTGRLRLHGGEQEREDPAVEPAAVPVRSPALFEEPLRFDPPAAPELSPTPLPDLPVPPAEPEGPPPLPTDAFGGASAAGPEPAPSPVEAPVSHGASAGSPSLVVPPVVEPAPKRRKYRNLRLYCSYLRWLSVLVAIGGVLGFFGQGFFLAAVWQQGAGVSVLLPALLSMLVTVGVTLGTYVLLNAAAELCQVAMDIEENTR